ncbi:MAG: helix-turn-helix domain-containing protein [Tannerella sp.]|nr:helix-turn-helix domain-containing protein [Tannerella sp.]
MEVVVETAIKRRADYYEIDDIGTVLTRKQAAAYLRLCQNKVDSLPIPKIRIGKSVRFRRVDIDSWLAQEAAKVVVK